MNTIERCLLVLPTPRRMIEWAIPSITTSPSSQIVYAIRFAQSIRQCAKLIIAVKTKQNELMLTEKTCLLCAQKDPFSLCFLIKQ